MSYRSELIQVAAVAVAAIQNLDHGKSTLYGFPEISKEIMEERKFQIAKWGMSNRHPFLWMTILGEEYGEVCEAALKVEFGEDEQSILEN